MIRTPLRPLARILTARANGENPDVIERENLRQRHAEMQAASRQRAEGRLLVLGVFFLVAFTAIAVRMGALATSEAVEPVASTAGGSGIAMQRADIVDRKGRILATNFETHSLYAQPPQMVDPEGAVERLVEIFPDLDRDRLLEDFTGKRKFVWIKKKISPEQKQAVHDIGDPGLLFGPREMRLYPNGSLAAHVMGGAGFGKEGVTAAEVIGVAGVEKQFDDYLRDPANGGRPLQLSLDLTVQAASEQVLLGGMKLMNAKGATSVLMDVYTGEVISVVSLPDFDPNDRPRPPTSGFDPSVSPLFNRAVQGVYELGSTFKIFTAAQAVDLGLVNSETIIDTSGPMRIGRFPIGEFNNKNYGKLSVADIIVNSSNRGTGRLALQIGAERQQQFLRALGMFDPTPIEIVEASGGQPLKPKKWGELSTVTISYGHGLSTSPMHLAAGYAAIANGGRYVSPTILRQTGPQLGDRVMSEDAAAQARAMLRKVVTSGTASFGEVPGYQVGGKTGTADKPKPRGGYYESKVIATFAAMFPAHDPKYVLIVTLDEPSVIAHGEERRTAGWTAVPVAGEMIGRIAPLLGLRPQVEPDQITGITLTSN
ncbi:peptidoglycan D,D-transpeptidase FtsI family protein [Phaeobacter italicus]|jgi:cell division protein FtsI (penicillin-binding protein 3)|uniref:Peptidoglycan synthase FtsI n=1 Tax=Phaeobacter italicus TaxID=481446 RepID=A0A0H5D3X0_9RHOB|nr:penicillin-binding protein 2 [Phaeobacter italicus]EEB70229.1 penicillin-binding protein [Ruegeria sp. R11]NKX71367.1 penicillin-binding protein 2 [Rhodobacteraceae bacterium R_SAG1]MBO9442865.1 penicillin-binding protein 2 [Phaeobacter italicus]MBY5975052.1 penicillin-binding protein 2 [Phaeobacter italicus]MBY6043243.1 penicillin-binding protein 2 [Phaeobacter italicus]